MGHRSSLVKGYKIKGDDSFFVCLVAKRVGKRTIQITLSLTWVCFSLWVLICFKFLGLVFSCGFDDFFGLFFSCWRFRWRIGILYEFLHVYLLRKCKKREENIEFLIFWATMFLGEEHEEQLLFK